MPDVPKTLKNRAVRKARFAQLKEPHIEKLTAFVEKLREEQDPADRNIPYFDPRDGGANAEILFLLETPGDKAVLSGFISRDNPDETAKNFLELTANIPRERTVLWNIVPWHVERDGVTPDDIKAGLSLLAQLLDLLPRLRIVVLVGNYAKKATKTIQLTRPNIQLLEIPHPSPMFINRNQQHNRQLIESKLSDVAMYLNSSKDTL